MYVMQNYVAAKNYTVLTDMIKGLEYSLKSKASKQ